MKVIVSADRTSDIPAEIVEQHKIKLAPYHIILDGKEYLDNVTITPAEIQQRFYDTGSLPLTAAVNVSEYVSFFGSIKQSYSDPVEIVHITLGSALTSSYQNAVLAAEKVGGVFPVDSCNLAGGSALMVMDAIRLAEKGKSALEIQSILNSKTSNYHADFVIGCYDFLKAGGRCSSIAALAGSALNIKPCIHVDNANHGAMNVQKSYRGKMKKVLIHYIKDILKQYPNIDFSEVIFETTELNPELDERNAMREYLEKEAPFEHYYYSNASCTITSHCGPGAYGMLFRTK